MWFLGNFLRIIQNATCRPPCLFSFVREWGESIQSPLRFNLLPDHLITRHRLPFAILRFGADYSSRKDDFYDRICDCKVPEGTHTSSLQGSKRSLVVFCIFLPQNHSKLWTQLQKNTASVPLVSVWLCENLRHVYARIGRKRFFSFRSDR